MDDGVFFTQKMFAIFIYEHSASHFRKHTYTFTHKYLQMYANLHVSLCIQVYLDNLSMELYNGRLDKTPGAIALRHRWYVHDI